MMCFCLLWPIEEDDLSNDGGIIFRKNFKSNRSINESIRHKVERPVRVQRVYDFNKVYHVYKLSSFISLVTFPFYNIFSNTKIILEQRLSRWRETKKFISKTKNDTICCIFPIIETPYSCDNKDLIRKVFWIIQFSL